MGIGNSLFWSTSHAFTQEIVSDKDYFNANKLLSASFQIGSILGASIGGIIVHIFNPFIALWMNVLTYIISGILISMAPFKNKKKKKTKSKNLIKSLLKGFTYLINRKDITALTTTTILSDVAIWGSLSVLTISISIEVFDKGAWGYGILDGLYGIGALLSVVIIGNLTNKFGRKNVLLICYIFAALSLYFSSIMPNIYIASLFFFILGANSNSARVIVRTILMENVSNQIMGRVQTVLGIYTRIMVVLSSLIAGYLIEHISINTAVIFTCLHYCYALIGVLIVNNFWKKARGYL